MAIPMNAALSAYNTAAKLAAEGGRPEAIPAAEPAGPDFAKVLSEAVQQVEQSGRVSETAQRALLDGKGSMVDVVTSVAQTQVAVEGLVAVRDRVISAYQQIMNMPI
jgi:flagellar hook-basal body complex protein FliE